MSKDSIQFLWKEVGKLRHEAISIQTSVHALISVIKCKKEDIKKILRKVNVLIEKVEKFEEDNNV